MNHNMILISLRRPFNSSGMATSQRYAAYYFTRLEIKSQHSRRYLSEKPPSSSSTSAKQSSTNSNNNSNASSSKETANQTNTITQTDHLASKTNQFLNTLQQNAQKSLSQATATLTTKARQSLTHAKLSAKERGEQIAWEARRKIQRNIDGQKEKAETFVKRTGEKTKEKAKEGFREGAERSKVFLRGTWGGVMEKFPYVLPRFSKYATKDVPRLPESSSGSGSETATATERITKSLDNGVSGSNSSSSRTDKGMATKFFDSAKSMLPSISSSKSKATKPQSLSNLSQPQQHMTEKAKNLTKSILTSETTTAFAGNIFSKFQDSVHKTTRWLWWWGLAAVGVYGITTTLTKEGMSILKEPVGLSKSSLNNEKGNGDRDTSNSGSSRSVNDLACSSPLDNDGYLNVESNLEMFNDDGVDCDKSGNCNGDLESSSSSWFSSLRRLVWGKAPTKNDG